MLLHKDSPPIILHVFALTETIPILPATKIKKNPCFHKHIHLHLSRVCALGYLVRRNEFGGRKRKEIKIEISDCTFARAIWNRGIMLRLFRLH